MDQVLAHLIHLNQTRSVRLIRAAVQDGTPSAAKANDTPASEQPSATQASQAIISPSPAEPGAGASAAGNSVADDLMADDLMAGTPPEVSGDAPANIKVPSPGAEAGARDARRSGRWPFARR